MVHIAAMVTPPEDVLPEVPYELRYVARQPILDIQGRVNSYELLFRAGPEKAFRGTGDVATRTMLDNTVMFGLDKLTAGLPAFVNCTMESLTELLVNVLPPSLTVLELVETVKPTSGLLVACRALKASGYRIALDNFIWKPEFEPLIELADFIKVDFTRTDAPGRLDLFKLLRDKPVVAVAEKVETREMHKQACAEGFTLFQGYYFCHPQMVKNRKIPANRLCYGQILRLLQRDPLDLDELSLLVRQDAALSFRFLRLINSPLCAMRQEVSSIKMALTLLGDDMVRHVATLAITSDFNANQPPAILQVAFTRARFCELAAKPCALSPSEQYLLGMFSLLPAMLRISMADLAPALSICTKIKEAWLGSTSLESSLLRWVEFHELGDWLNCDLIVQTYGLNQDEMTSCYAEAAIWADAALHVVRHRAP